MKCSRPGCTNEATKFLSTANYCPLHNRFLTMRNHAKMAGKYVPSWEELEALLPADMHCPLCYEPMVLGVARGESIARVVSLQHWKDKPVSCICTGCNARRNYHEVQPPEGYKRCSSCAKTKLPHEFTKDAQAPDGKYTYCRDCANEKQRARKAASR